MKNKGFRFLFVTSDPFPPFRPDVEILFGKEFLNRGYSIDWIMQSEESGQRAECVEWRGCKVWLASADAGAGRLDRVRKHVSFLRNDMRVFSVARSGDYDFIQVKDKFLGAVMAIVAARRRGIKFFFWLSFPFPEHYFALAKSPESRYRFFYLLRGLTFKYLLYRVICRRADHVFVQSEEMKRVMNEKGVPKEKMTPVPMGVDLDTFEVGDAAPTKPTGDTSPSILYLGSLDRLRRVDFLLEVFAVLVEKYPKAKLYFVGDSEDPEARVFLEDEARRLGVEDNVVFTGFLAREEALDYVRAATVCVALTRSDATYGVASSTKLIEYMALEKPVLANTHPDQEQVIRESGGGLCVPWELESFVDGLTWLLEHPSEAIAMGKKGRDYVKRARSYEAIADSLAAQYSRLMEEDA
jgi:glycosyltransferase involved in cell wall biosynthesis